MQPLYGLVLLISLLETGAQYFIKKFNKCQSISYYLLGVCLYAAIAFLLSKTYNFTSMGVTQALWSGTSIIAISITGVLFFDETITICEAFGIMLILAGVATTQLYK